MTKNAAIQLIRKGVRKSQNTWGDFGAGGGTFTIALGELLGSEGMIYAIDQSPSISKSVMSTVQAKIQVIQADISQPLDLPVLDGAIVANVLHYTPNPQKWIEHIHSYLRTGGSMIIIEYDTDRGNPWVPYPISRDKLFDILEEMGLLDIEEIGRKRSVYRVREIYSVRIGI